MTVATDDLVRSKGRIQVLQDGRMRFIAFGTAKVIDVGGGGITVNPLGKSAVLLCNPEDLELAEPSSKQLDETSSSRESATQQAEANKGVPAPPVTPVDIEVKVTPVAESKPEGNIVVEGKLLDEPKPKQGLRELREQKRAVAKSEKSKPTPRRRRR